MTVITIDGPSGAGKSTIAKILADDLGFSYLDTGAMYRAITFYLLNSNIDLNSEEDICNSIKDVDIQNHHGLTWVNGVNVSNKIRLKNVTDKVSLVSSYLCVREKLVDLQRQICSNFDTILDGRDTGSVVVPKADYKFYLTADSLERARRRFNQDTEGRALEEIHNSIIDRDKKDMSRKISPLIVPDDGIIIDSTNLNIEETVNKIKSYLEE